MTRRKMFSKTGAVSDLLEKFAPILAVAVDDAVPEGKLQVRDANKFKMFEVKCANVEEADVEKPKAVHDYLGDMRDEEVSEDSTSVNFKVADGPRPPQLPKPIELFQGMIDDPLRQRKHADASILCCFPSASQHLVTFVTFAIEFDPGGLARMVNFLLTLLVFNEDSLHMMFVLICAVNTLTQVDDETSCSPH